MGEIRDLHQSVLAEEVLKALDPKPGGIYVDGTLGMGGHTEALLARCPDIRLVVGLDWDSETLGKARRRLASFGDQVLLVQSNFIAIPDVLLAHNMRGVDGIILDLGISSFQLDASGRGFSFSREEPLDMRMNRSEPVTAADMVNELPQAALEDLIRTYGEERWARRIAQFIVKTRETAPIRTTAELARIVFSAIPRKYHPRRIHPATRTFQALRIAVNRELDNLKTALDQLPECLKPSGRLCIISFHSLEDRLVKLAFREDPRLRPLVKKPVTPTPEEEDRNPRSRSAKLRVAERIHPEPTAEDFLRSKGGR